MGVRLERHSELTYGFVTVLFDLDDEDYAVVKKDPIPDDQQDLAEQAIAECPRAAILRKD